MPSKQPKAKLSERLSNAFQHYPVLVTSAIVLIIGGLIFILTRREATPEEVVVEDVQVDDSLALNIICVPTLECLPFYYAKESGLCDSLHLSLGIYTETSQFDVDSIMRRTKSIDGAVFDTYRLAYYKKRNQTLPIRESINLYGTWRLVVAEQLRIREIEKLKKRTVATARFATSSLLLEQSLSGKKDLKYADFYHAQINDFGIRTNMLDENQIDAALLPEPYASLAMSRGHRSVWTKKLVSTLVLAFRLPVFKDERKAKQVEKLRQVYNEAVLQLNLHGTHAADSALIKSYKLPKEVIDTLRLPEYRPL